MHAAGSQSHLILGSVSINVKCVASFTVGLLEKGGWALGRQEWGPVTSGVGMKPDGHLTAWNRSSPTPPTTLCTGLRFYILPQLLALSTPHWSSLLCSEVGPNSSLP